MPTNKNQNQSSNRSSSNKTQQSNKSQGRGWHGDPEGHARAGSQSHKND